MSKVRADGISTLCFCKWGRTFAIGYDMDAFLNAASAYAATVQSGPPVTGITVLRLKVRMPDTALASVLSECGFSMCGHRCPKQYPRGTHRRFPLQTRRCGRCKGFFGVTDVQDFGGPSYFKAHILPAVNVSPGQGGKAVIVVTFSQHKAIITIMVRRCGA